MVNVNFNMYICHVRLLYLNIISRMVNWILLLGSIYVASILCYDIYKDTTVPLKWTNRSLN